MNTYKFTVKDNFFPQTFNGEVEAVSMEAAKLEVIDIYTYELDTDEDSLIITIELA